MEEKWMPIEGFGDAYSVSDLGRIMRTSPRNIRRLTGGGRPSRAQPFVPSLVKGFVHKNGYEQVRIGPSGAQKTTMVHRLVAAAFVPNPNGYATVNHRDGVKSNNRAANLEWVTHSQNLKHAVETGLQVVKRGRDNGMAKLSDDAVIAIRGDTRILRLIANDYGVSISLVNQIKQRRIWAHV